jgi:dynein heavy chain, axonemal
LEFFDKPEQRVLTFYTDAKDQLTPTLTFPGLLKKKAVFFRKRGEFVVNNENVKTLDFGDLSYAPIEQVSAMVGGLVVPVLANKGNSTAWPGVVAEDLVRHANVSSPLECRVSN